MKLAYHTVASTVGVKMYNMSMHAVRTRKIIFHNQWKMMGSTSLASDASRTNFEIKSVTFSNSGSYYCALMNQWGI